MSFTAADVKTLREMTSVGMMDCKKALQATDGDMDKAVDWLREKGLAKAYIGNSFIIFKNIANFSPINHVPVCGTSNYHLLV